MRIYLDNCCYNRPYDDQNQMRIHLETQAKLYIQEMIKNGSLELVTSYVLDYENSQNRSAQKRNAISKFMEEYEAIAESNYFITTDDRLLKYTSDKVAIVTPGEFIRKLEAGI